MVHLLAWRMTWLAVAGTALTVAGALGSGSARAAAVIGHPDQPLGTAFGQVEPAPPKPEHRLWHAANSWWGVLPASHRTGYTIWQLAKSGAWSDTGVVVDERSDSGADTLYNGKHLFVATHQFTASYTTATKATSSLLRFSLTAGTWTLDQGFPVPLTNTSMPALSIGQDGTGRLIAAYVSSAHPWYVVTDNDADSDEFPVTFSQPIKLTWTGNTLDPAAATTLTGDDIAAVTSGNGFTTVVWSNQTHDSEHNGFYAARHRDGTAFRTANWSAAAVTPPGVNSADNHIALTTIPGDARARVFAVLKTSKNDPTRKIASDPQLLFAVFTPSDPDDMLLGRWKTIRLTSVGQGGTRPAMVIDRSLARARVFYAAPWDAGTITEKHNQGVIFEKQVDYEKLTTPSGRGVVVQRDPRRDLLDDPTTTAQVSDANSGTVVVSYLRPTASGPGRFWHSGVPGFRAAPQTPGTETALASPREPPVAGTSIPTFGSRAKDLASRIRDLASGSPGRYVVPGVLGLALVMIMMEIGRRRRQARRRRRRQRRAARQPRTRY